MIDTRKLYKYTAIISATIVLILIANLIIPIFAIAKEAEGMTVGKITFNEEAQTLSIKIAVSSEEYNTYSVYWIKGEIDNSKLEDNTYIDTLITNDAFSSVLNERADGIEREYSVQDIERTTEDQKYNVLCVSETQTEIYVSTIEIKAKTEPQEIENTITMNLTQDSNYVNINVWDPYYDINQVKIAKSEQPMKCADFAEAGTDLSSYFEVGKNVEFSYEITEGSGIYYVYAKSSANTERVEGINITIGETPEPEKDTTPPTIEEIEVSSDNNSVTVKVNASAKNEKTLTKYYYYLSNDGTNWNTPIVAASGEYKFDGLNEDTTYYVKAQVEDNNEIKSEETGVNEIKTTKTETPEPEEPTPEDPTPEDPTPEDPEPEEPTPVDPEPSDPTPVDPEPSDPTPVDPEPEDQTPTEPSEGGKEDEPIIVPVDDESGNNTGYNEAEDNGNSDESSSNVNNSKNSNTSNTENKNSNASTNTQTTEKSTNKESIVQEVVTKKSEEDIPQTGSNDTALIVGIIVFSIIGLGSFAKYKRIK